MKQFIVHGSVPSKKNSKQISVRYGKPFVRCSDKYTQWHAKACEELLMQKKGFTTDRCKMILSFYYGDKRKRDADNATSSIFDTLKDVGIITDDNYNIIYKYIVEADYDKENPRCEIKIYEPDELIYYNF